MSHSSNTSETEQEILNQSFDKTYHAQKVIPLAQNGLLMENLVKDDATDGLKVYVTNPAEASESSGLTDDELRATPVPVSGSFYQATQPVSAASLPLPTGAATAAKQLADNHQVTANAGTNLNTSALALESGGNLASIKTNTDKLPSQGQALAAASMPVVLPAAQITALTPPAAITGFATSAKQDTLLTELQAKADLNETQPVSLASVPSHPVTNAGTFAVQNTAALPAGTNAIGKLAANDGVDVGDVTINNPTLAVTQSGVFTVQPGNTANTSAWLVKQSIDNAIQPVMLSWEEMAGTAGAESNLTNATFRTENLVALGAATSYTVPVGKRLRITNVSCYVKASSTVNNLSRHRIRAVAAAPVANNSAPVFDTILALDAPGTVAAGLLKQQTYTIPEGSLDFAAGTQLAYTWFTAANTCTTGMSIIGYLYTP